MNGFVLGLRADPKFMLAIQDFMLKTSDFEEQKGLPKFV
jgi:hypothetical protein